MFRPLRENGPALLVPAAWLVVAATVLEVVSTHALFVAHVVMAALLATFAVTGWAEMSAGVLRAWRTIIAVGFAATTLGVIGFVAGPDPLLDPIPVVEHRSDPRVLRPDRRLPPRRKAVPLTRSPGIFGCLGLVAHDPRQTMLSSLGTVPITLNLSDRARDVDKFERRPAERAVTSPISRFPRPCSSIPPSPFFNIRF